MYTQQVYPVERKEFPRLVFALCNSQEPAYHLATELSFVMDPTSGRFTLPILSENRNIRITIPAPVSPIPAVYPEWSAFTKETLDHLSVVIWFGYGNLTIKLSEEKNGIMNENRPGFIHFGSGLYVGHRYDAAMGRTLMTAIGLKVSYIEKIKSILERSFAQVATELAEKPFRVSVTQPMVRILTYTGIPLNNSKVLKRKRTAVDEETVPETSPLKRARKNTVDQALYIPSPPAALAPAH